MKIYVKQPYDEKKNKIPVTLPEKGSSVAAGYDIVATSDPKIVGEQTVDALAWKRIDYIEYETNLFIAPSATAFHTLIHPRSSVSKYNLVLANSIGLVDNDYRGMVICRFKYIIQPEDCIFSLGLITAHVNLDRIYKKGDKIAQLVFEPTVQVEFELVDDLQATERGAGGFGSTDKKAGKPITEVFAEEATKFKAQQEQPASSILDKYKQTGGVKTDIPYSERIRKREQS